MNQIFAVLNQFSSALSSGGSLIKPAFKAAIQVAAFQMERHRESDEKLRPSQEQDHRISEEKVKILQNRIERLNKHIGELEGELDICLLTSGQMPAK